MTTSPDLSRPLRGEVPRPRRRPLLLSLFLTGRGEVTEWTSSFTFKTNNPPGEVGPAVVHSAMSPGRPSAASCIQPQLLGLSMVSLVLKLGQQRGEVANTSHWVFHTDGHRYGPRPAIISSGSQARSTARRLDGAPVTSTATGAGHGKSPKVFAALHDPRFFWLGLYHHSVNPRYLSEIEGVG